MVLFITTLISKDMVVDDGTGQGLEWGGYCHHGNILFPTWHRVYLLRLEAALRQYEPDVALPYWDYADEKFFPPINATDNQIIEFIPWIFRAKNYTFEDSFDRSIFSSTGKTIPNPLYSYKLPELVEVRERNLNDSDGNTPLPTYFDFSLSKPKGYETRRAPYAGMVASRADAVNTAKINSAIDNETANVYPNFNTYADLLLAKTILLYLRVPFVRSNNLPPYRSVVERLQFALQSEFYATFSNTSTVGKYNTLIPQSDAPLEALEQPHNCIHLAIGGFDAHFHFREGGLLAKGASGDMAFNEVAGFDPIFYFHHCNIDRVFFAWQKYHGVDTVEAFKNNHRLFLSHLQGTYQVDPYSGGWGFNTNDSQGWTPGLLPNQVLSFNTELYPFEKAEGGYYTSDDVVDLANLPYKYESIPSYAIPDDMLQLQKESTNVVIKLNKLTVYGPFALALYAGSDEEVLVDYETVFNRRKPNACPNCVAQQAYTTTLLVPRSLKDADLKLRIFLTEGYFEQKLLLANGVEVDLSDTLGTLNDLISYPQMN